MLCYNGTDISKGIEDNKTSASKERIIGLYRFFVIW